MRDTKIKIRLSTPGLSLNVEVPEEKFMDAFRKVADTLFAYATKPAGLPAPETADSMFEDFTTSPITKESVKVDDTPMPVKAEHLQKEDHCETLKRNIPTMQATTTEDKTEAEVRRDIKGFF